MNLVTIVSVGHDNLKSTVDIVVCPLAWFDGSSYHDASVDNLSAALAARAKYYASKPVFYVVQNGISLSTLTPTDGVVRACGDYGGRAAVVLYGAPANTLYGEIDFPAQRSHPSSDYDSFNKTAVAVSRSVPNRHGALTQTKANLKRYTRDLKQAGAKLAAGAHFTLLQMRVLDLGDGGQPDIYGKLWAYVPSSPSSRTPQHSSILYVSIWLRYNGSRPTVIGTLKSVQDYGSWGSGDDYVGSVNVRPGGVDDIVIMHAGWEDLEFRIYTFARGGLTQVFEGGSPLGGP